MKTELVLRAVLLLLLGVLAVLAPGAGDPARGVLRIGEALEPGELRGVLRDAPRALVRESASPPTAAELERLAALAPTVTILARLPGDAPPVEIDAPVGLRAGRTAAVGYRVRGPAGDTMRVVLRDALGILDTGRVALDRNGFGEGAFRVRPRTRGWQQWMVETAGGRGIAGAWADSAAPLRVLLHAGMPGWESKFVARALEESGARVSARYELGRGLDVGAGGEGLTRSALSGVDVVVVLDGAPLSTEQSRMLADWAAAGGGVLLAGDRAALPAFGLVGGIAGVGEMRGDALRWEVPPQLLGLPAVTFATSITTLREPMPGTAVMARNASGMVMVSRPLGAGRVAALGVTESWRWRMEGGELDAHRDFWRSLADFLAAAPPRLRVDPAIAAVGERVTVTEWPGGQGGAAPRLIVPDGSAVALPAQPAEGGLRVASFVPSRTGIHRVVASSGDEAAFRVDSGGSSSGWARLAILAARSGGGLFPADSLSLRLAALEASNPRWRPPAGLFLGMILLLAGAVWAVRRLRGQP